jgi:hypothetical protein
MDRQLMIKKHHNRCMLMAKAAKARLQILIKTFDVIPVSMRAIYIAWIQVIKTYVCALWYDPKDVERQYHLQLLLNQQARSMISRLPTQHKGLG